MKKVNCDSTPRTYTEKTAEFDPKTRMVTCQGGTEGDPFTIEDVKRLCPEALGKDGELQISGMDIGGPAQLDGPFVMK